MEKVEEVVQRKQRLNVKEGIVPIDFDVASEILRAVNEEEEAKFYWDAQILKIDRTRKDGTSQSSVFIREGFKLGEPTQYYPNDGTMHHVFDNEGNRIMSVYDPDMKKVIEC